MRSWCSFIGRTPIQASLVIGAVLACGGIAAALEPETRPAVDPRGSNVVLLRPGQKLGPMPVGVDDDPIAPCTLGTNNCQSFEYPRVGGTSQGSGGTGINGFPDGFSLQRVCDHFRPVASGNITQICWWGTYGNPPAGGACGDLPTDPNIDNFVVTYYARTAAGPNAGLPDTGAIIGGPFVQDSGQLTVARRGLCDSGGRTSAAYSATHAAVAVTANTCYFIEIRNLTDGVTTWFWSRTAPNIDNVCYIDLTSDGYQATEAAAGDRAFCVGINIDPFGQGSQACLPPANPPPDNDQCGAAAALTGTGSTAFDNINATTGVENQANAACDYAGSGGPGIQRDVWYDWTAAAAGFSTGQMISASVGTCGSGLILDSKIAIFRRPTGGGCPTGADIVDCIDDVCDSTPVNNANVAARVTFNAVVGNHYMLQVGGASLGQTGVQTLLITAVAPTGRCCLSDGNCAVVTSARCTAMTGTYGGDGSACGGTYAASTGTTPLEDIGATGTVVSFVQGDDDYTAAPTPFPVRFFGGETSSVNIGVNGQVSATGPLYTYANTWTIPTHPVEPNNYAAVLADDFLTPPGGGCGDVRFETRGTAPNRRFIVQWNHICHFSAVDDNTFQAIFYEGSGNVEFRYQSTNPAEITPTGGVGTGYIIGLESESGANSVAIDSGTNPPPTPGSSILFTYNSDPGDVCPASGGCGCDWNHSGQVNSQDFFDFLTGFFNNNADYNHDNQTNSQDYFDFLTCFFTLPPPCH